MAVEVVMERIAPVFLFQKIFNDHTGTAFFTLFFECTTLGAFAHGATNEPAHMSGLKLPGRTLLFHPTLDNIPAHLSVYETPSLIAEEIPQLAFDIRRNISGALLIRLYRL